MTELGWISGSVRFVARFLRAYPLMQISTAAALWTPLSTGLRYVLEYVGWLGPVDAATGRLGIPISAAGISGIFAFVLVGLFQQIKRRAYRSQRAKALAKRDLRDAEKARKIRDAQEESAKAEFEVNSQAFAAMSPEMKMVLRQAVVTRRSTVGVGGASTDMTVAARQLDDLGYVSFHHDYGGGRHSATLMDSVFKFLFANPGIVGAEAERLVHKDKLKLG